MSCMKLKVKRGKKWLAALEKPTIPVVADPVEVLHNCLVYKKQILFGFF